MTFEFSQLQSLGISFKYTKKEGREERFYFRDAIDHVEYLLSFDQEMVRIIRPHKKASEKRVWTKVLLTANVLFEQLSKNPLYRLRILTGVIRFEHDGEEIRIERFCLGNSLRIRMKNSCFHLLFFFSVFSVFSTVCFVGLIQTDLGTQTGYSLPSLLFSIALLWSGLFSIVSGKHVFGDLHEAIQDHRFFKHYKNLRKSS